MFNPSTMRSIEDRPATVVNKLWELNSSDIIDGRCDIFAAPVHRLEQIARREREGRRSAHLPDCQNPARRDDGHATDSARSIRRSSSRGRVDRLPMMPIVQLRARYRAVFRSVPSKPFGPDLLRRCIAYRIQGEGLWQVLPLGAAACSIR